MAKKIRFFSLVIIFILLFSACSISRPAENQEAEQPDILLAHDCGFDRLKCCREEPSCKYGQECCQDPNNEANNYCADTCGCGGLEEFCCSGNICQDDLRCYQGLCAECGGGGQICCQGEIACRGGFVCSGNECLICGIAGHPCCESGTKCDLENDPSENRTQCADGWCQACGSDGRPACSSRPECVAGQLFNNGNCFRCGGENQPCCADELSGGLACDAKKGLACFKGFCEKTSR